MADHTSNALLAAARAMEEVILPAVDPAHPLAREQATLVLKFLRLFESRLDYLHDRNRFELRHYLHLAEDLAAAPLPDSAALREALERAVLRGTELTRTADARSPDLQAAAQRLAGVISAIVRTAVSTAHPSTEMLEAIVLAKSEELLDVQRAWFLPQGWEPDPQKVVPLEIILAKRCGLLPVHANDPRAG